MAYQELKVSRSKHDQPKHILSETRSWVELYSIREVNSGDVDIVADLADVSIPAEFDQLETDDNVFFFEQ